MLGDGVQRCDFHIFATTLEVAVADVHSNVYNATYIIDQLFALGVLPATVQRADVNVEFGQYRVPDVQSMVWTGLSIKLKVYSSNDASMRAVTGGINTGPPLEQLCQMLAQSACIIIRSPMSTAQTVDQAFGPIVSILPGFAVSSVAYNFPELSWVVKASYLSDIPNTVAAMYISKSSHPATQQDKNSFFISQHPCLKSSSVCCLNDFKNIYEIGYFNHNVTDTIGVCPLSVQVAPTVGMFDPDGDTALIDLFFEMYPLSYVKRLSSTDLELHIHAQDLKKNFAIASSVNGGVQMEFFVGMSYFTLLPVGAMTTVASQTKIVVTTSNSITFSFATQQDYTFLKYVTMALYSVSPMTHTVSCHYPGVAACQALSECVRGHRLLW